MIVCPNCNHPNPEGAQACEACYTPLPATASCPNCGTSVQTDSRFCGQCGFDLHSSAATAAVSSLDIDIPHTFAEFVPPEPLVEPEQPLAESEHPTSNLSSPNIAPVPVTEVTNYSANSSNTPSPTENQPKPTPVVSHASKTQLQQHKAQLLHVQSNSVIELPQNLPVIHIGKPNDRIPPDIDVAGFSNSEIVSRIHADIRPEGDAFYLEDVGSSNGTYVNNMPLLPGNRHRLRVGDRIALGKGDLVTFLFQMS